MTKEYSCGAILFCRENDIKKYVLVMEASGSYGFPKGHKEGNETDIETALREIREETGIIPEILPNIKRTIRYKLPNNAEKEVTFFAARYENQSLHTEDRTILSVKSYDLATALGLLKFQELKNILLEIDYILDLKGV